MKFIHIADIHADGNPTKLQKLRSNLDELIEFLQSEQIEAVVIAGDIWERTQTLNAESGVLTIIEYLKKMSKLVRYIFITKGNNEHDNPGSIAALHQIESNIYAYEYPAMLAIKGDGRVSDILKEEIMFKPEYLVTLFPYPTKAGIADLSLGINDANEETKEVFHHVFTAIGMKKEQYPSTPHIFAFHGTISGSKLSNGQTMVGKSLEFGTEALQMAKADYYALGHIHLRQEMANNMLYCGSMYNKDWGETEKKSFELIEIETHPIDNSYKVKHKPVCYKNARPLTKLKAVYDPLTNNLNVEDFEFWKDNNPYVRIEFQINNNEKSIFDEKSLIEKLQEKYGEDVVLKYTVTPTEREARSSEIMQATDLLGEVVAYANTINIVLTEGHIGKIKEIEAKVANSKKY